MKIRKTVRAIILDLNARIPLIQHKELRENGTEHIFWAVLGGGVENGENDEQALKRELYEEPALLGDLQEHVEKFSFVASKNELFQFVNELPNRFVCVTIRNISCRHMH